MSTWWAEQINCGHKWQVYSTAIMQVCLMLRCVKCEADGTVDDPTKAEWSKAFYTPSHPYIWHDNSRVSIKGNKE